MPAILPNTPTADAYPTSAQSAGCQVGLNDVYASGYFVVANAAALAQYQHGLQGQQDFSSDIFLPPATYPLVGSDQDPLGGIKFKSAVTGIPAQVFGVLYKKNESALLAGSEFSSAVSTSGGITPPGSGIEGLTGYVSGAGAIIAGSGFTVVRTAAGRYTITFVPALAAVPVVVLSVTVGLSANEDIVALNPGPTINGFLVAVNEAGVNVDRGFSFLAITPR